MNRLALLLLTFLVLSSCGKNLTVNLAETALLWRIDDYFDINRDQRNEIKSKFRQALKSADQKYIPGFEKIILSDELVAKDCSQVEKSYYTLKPQLEEMRTEFLKQSSGFVDSIKSDQMTYFFKEASHEIAKDENGSNSDRASKVEKRLKRTQDVMQELFGDLTAEQQQSLQNHILNQKHHDKLILESRKKNLAILQKKSEAEVKNFMKDYLIQWRNYQTPELSAAMQDREISNEKFYLNFFCQASEKQKKQFQKTIMEYLDLIRKVYIAQN